MYSNNDFIVRVNGFFSKLLRIRRLVRQRCLVLAIAPLLQRLGALRGVRRDLGRGKSVTV